jgi:hypothetical protein
VNFVVFFVILNVFKVFISVLQNFLRCQEKVDEYQC